VELHFNWLVMLGIVTTIMQGLTSGTIHLTNAIPDSWIPRVTAWAGIFATLNSVILTGAISSQVPAVPKAAASIGRYIMSSIITPAEAQSTRAARPTIKLPTLPTLTGNPIQDFNTNVKNAVTSPNNPITQLLKDFSTIIGDDITGAQALSVQIPDLQDGNGYACWTEAVKFKEVIDAHPIPLTFQAATDFEGLRLAIMAADRLCNNSACTVIFSDGANLANQLASAAGGALTIPLPSLSALCSKVPSFAVVAPPPAATPVTPAAISNATKAVTAPAATPLTAPQ
jgi:hypothetical protein